jgi:lipopolysaccharide transport system ATP-binding protein
MGVVIKVENLSKQYRLGEVGTGTLKDDFKRFRYRLMGKEDPFLQVGEVNDRTQKSSSDYVWALRDINFEIAQGDVVGIIGRNGAGKSTLLKILSRTTAPTTGSVKVKGRIASLLEVGTGFHGELSGRENIYLNGAIMGLRKWEIDRKLDEIIEFAGVEKYLDTPVKRYSSGMYVRLAFAVAAHLEPDILIVDEVLAVGDAEFQKKCIGKMKEVNGMDGRTILVVSHNMNVIQNLCNQCIYMNNGSVLLNDKISIVLKAYLKSSIGKIYTSTSDKQSQDIYFKSICLHNENVSVNGEIILDFVISSKINALTSIDIKILSDSNIPVGFCSLGTLNYDEMIAIKPGDNNVKLKIFVGNLALGEYILSIDITKPNEKYYDRCDDCLSFEVVKIDSMSRQLEQQWNFGFFILPLEKI